MTVVPIWLLIAMLSIVLVLVGAAVFYCVKLFHAQKRQAEQLAEQQAAAQAQRQRVNASIQILAKALLDDGIVLTEAAIRIRALLDALQVAQPVRDEFVAFYTLAAKTSHIPILQDWKSLPRTQKFAFEQEMAQIEGEYRDFILDAARRIRGRVF